MVFPTRTMKNKQNLIFSIIRVKILLCLKYLVFWGGRNLFYSLFYRKYVFPNANRYLYFGAHVKLNTTTRFCRRRPNARCRRYICITSQTSWAISRNFQIYFFEKYKSGKDREIILSLKKNKKLANWKAQLFVNGCFPFFRIFFANFELFG